MTPGRASGLTSVLPPQQEALYMKGRELTPQLSQSSVLSLADSHTEFFDACEVLLSASSSENEVRGKGSQQREGRDPGDRGVASRETRIYSLPSPFRPAGFVGPCSEISAGGPFLQFNVPCPHGFS